MYIITVGVLEVIIYVNVNQISFLCRLLSREESVAPQASYVQ